MEITSWITLAAVIVALGIGVASILHTQRLQKQGRRDRQLSEIIEWASNITKFEWYKDYPYMFNIQNREKLELFMQFHLGELHSNLTNIRAQNHYISVIALIFGKDLYEFVAELILYFEVQINLIDNLRKTITVEEESNKVVEKLSQNEHKLNELSKKVIEEAAKIKTEI